MPLEQESISIRLHIRKGAAIVRGIAMSHRPSMDDTSPYLSVEVEVGETSISLCGQVEQLRQVQAHIKTGIDLAMKHYYDHNAPK